MILGYASLNHTDSHRSNINQSDSMGLNNELMRIQIDSINGQYYFNRKSVLNRAANESGQPDWITLNDHKSGSIRINQAELVKIILTSKIFIYIESAWFMLIEQIMGNHYESDELLQIRLNHAESVWVIFCSGISEYIEWIGFPRIDIDSMWFSVIQSDSGWSKRIMLLSGCIRLNGSWAAYISDQLI